MRLAPLILLLAAAAALDEPATAGGDDAAADTMRSFFDKFDAQKELATRKHGGRFTEHFLWQKPSVQYRFEFPDRVHRDVEGRPLEGPHQRTFEASQKERHARLKPILEPMAARWNNTIVTMLVNYGQLKLLQNWACSCEYRRIPWRSFTFTYSLDPKTAPVLEAMGMPFTLLESSTVGETAARTFGDYIFHKVVFFKSAVVWDMLLMGFNVLFQDVDLVWKVNPIPFFHAPQWRPLDAAFMYDGGNKIFSPIYANTGFFFLRQGEPTLRLMEEVWLKASSSNSQQVRRAAAEPHLLRLPVCARSSVVGMAGDHGAAAGAPLLQLRPQSAHPAARLRQRQPLRVAPLLPAARVAGGARELDRERDEQGAQAARHRRGP